MTARAGGDAPSESSEPAGTPSATAEPARAGPSAPAAGPSYASELAASRARADAYCACHDVACAQRVFETGSWPFPRNVGRTVEDIAATEAEDNRAFLCRYQLEHSDRVTPVTAVEQLATALCACTDQRCGEQTLAAAGRAVAAARRFAQENDARALQLWLDKGSQCLAAARSP